jgi:cell cycle arrest protein BUB2
MTSFPAQHVPSTSAGNPPQQLTSPRSTRTLRKLQSAHQLSSHYSALNAPSLISQQRQQQRNPSSTQNQGIPPIPPQHSPNKPNHHRTRSNSDAIPPSTASLEPMSRRTAPPRRQINFQPPKDQLKALISHGPKGDVEGSLRRLRHLILEDGLEADNDGMVGQKGF